MTSQAWSITPQELKGCINAVLAVDVREPEEHAEGVLPAPNLKLIPLGELGERAAGELDREADIVVYCAHGVRSIQGLMVLKQLGFKKVRSLEGGIAAWLEQGL